MARLEFLSYNPHRAVVSGQQVTWAAVSGGRGIDGLPQIFWDDSTPWREANLWMLERATSKSVDLKTVKSSAAALHSYASWLETSKAHWWDFPVKKADRCLVRYRGALIDARDQGEIAPSTAAQRMRVAIRFYRWLTATGLLSPDWPMWSERIVGIPISNPVGLQRTLSVSTTDLSIPNRRAPGERLEDGLLPLAASDRDELLSFAQQYSTEELFLLLSCGFFTGMRLGTLTNLKIQSLTNAVPDPAGPDLYRIAIGPGASPPVTTKYGVTGQAWITRPHLDRLLQYAYSTRRLHREAKAKREHKDLVFLTRFGNPYAERNSDKSAAINVEMHALRKRALASGLDFMREFRFHQTRCTFATELARLAIEVCGPINALALVKDALLHKDEATTLKYIRFLAKSKAKKEAANAFTEAFLGVLTSQGLKEGA